MKKLIISLFVGLAFISTLALATTDFSEKGWSSSTGYNSMPGYAANVRNIENGYSFRCCGVKGTCYQINGGFLEIFDTPNSWQNTDPLINIFKI